MIKMTKEVQRDFFDEVKAASKKHNWGYTETLTDPRNAPNEVIETLVFRGYRMAFGIKKKIPENIMDWLRSELNRRNRNGVYIFHNRSERKRMRRLATTMC